MSAEVARYVSRYVSRKWRIRQLADGCMSGRRKRDRTHADCAKDVCDLINLLQD